MKKLKPGQLYTVNKHVYRCSKRTIDPCIVCKGQARKKGLLPVCTSNKINSANCAFIFGWHSYPILVK